MDSLLSAFGDKNAFLTIAPVIGALLTGVAVGWVIWGGRADEEASVERSAADQGEGHAPDIERVRRLEEELREARRLLAATKGRDDDFAQDLSTLDAAVKRAAGRIALIARGAKT